MLALSSFQRMTRLPRPSSLLPTFALGIPRSLSTPSQPSSSTSTDNSNLTPTEIRLKAIKLYKELHRLGRDYPDPDYDFNGRLRRAWEKNSKTKDPKEMLKQLELAEHIKKEVKALISLKKYRHLKRTYYASPEPSSH